MYYSSSTSFWDSHALVRKQQKLSYMEETFISLALTMRAVYGVSKALRLPLHMSMKSHVYHNLSLLCSYPVCQSKGLNFYAREIQRVRHIGSRRITLIGKRNWTWRTGTSLWMTIRHSIQH